MKIFEAKFAHPQISQPLVMQKIIQNVTNSNNSSIAIQLINLGTHIHNSSCVTMQLLVLNTCWCGRTPHSIVTCC